MFCPYVNIVDFVFEKKSHVGSADSIDYKTVRISQWYTSIQECCDRMRNIRAKERQEHSWNSDWERVMKLFLQAHHIPCGRLIYNISRSLLDCCIVCWCGTTNLVVMMFDVKESPITWGWHIQEVINSFHDAFNSYGRDPLPPQIERYLSRTWGVLINWGCTDAFVWINVTVLGYIGMKDPCEESHPRTAHRITWWNDEFDMERGRMVWRRRRRICEICKTMWTIEQVWMRCCFCQSGSIPSCQFRRVIERCHGQHSLVPPRLMRCWFIWW